MLLHALFKSMSFAMTLYKFLCCEFKCHIVAELLDFESSENLTSFALPIENRCNQAGVAYVAFSQWIAVIVIYTFVYHMLEPPEEYYELVSEDAEEGSVKGGNAALNATLESESMPSVTSAEWPDVKDATTEEMRTPLLARVFRYPSVSSQTSAGEEMWKA